MVLSLRCSVSNSTTEVGSLMNSPTYSSQNAAEFCWGGFVAESLGPLDSSSSLSQPSQKFSEPSKGRRLLTAALSLVFFLRRFIAFTFPSLLTPLSRLVKQRDGRFSRTAPSSFTTLTLSPFLHSWGLFFFKRIPHALHNVPFPSGPLRFRLLKIKRQRKIVSSSFEF